MKQATRVVELTSRGRAAVAVVLVEGSDALSAVDACFHAASGRPIADTASGRIVLGRWRAGSSSTPIQGANSSSSLHGEELIACRRSGERVEIHCHGGAAAVRAVVERLTECGCQLMRWQDWLPAAEPNPIRAAAAAALSDAATARTAAVLLDQYDGSLEIAIRAILAAAARGDWSAATSAINAVLNDRHVGAHLIVPWQVVLAGRPNVGKSSLKNALVGYERAIVCDLPGTTRDVVTTVTAIDGWPIVLSDTAGLRPAADPLEAAGVARTAAALQEADLVLLVDEVGGDASDSSVPPSVPVIRVLNKIDLASPSEQYAGGPWDMVTSATKGEGLERLLSLIGERLVPNPPPAGAAVAFTTDQTARLEVARAAAAQRDLQQLSACLQPLLAV
jgi:tRNA modification GTPase